MTTFFIVGCSAKEVTYEEFDPNASYEEILKASKGSTVSFYGWGGDEDRNKWLNETVSPILKEKYDITLDLVGMDINDVLAKLSGEKQSGEKEGSIDMIWINGENFYSAKENDLLLSFKVPGTDFKTYLAFKRIITIELTNI